MSPAREEIPATWPATYGGHTKSKFSRTPRWPVSDEPRAWDLNETLVKQAVLCLRVQATCFQMQGSLYKNCVLFTTCQPQLLATVFIITFVGGGMHALMDQHILFFQIKVSKFSKNSGKWLCCWPRHHQSSPSVYDRKQHCLAMDRVW